MFNISFLFIRRYGYLLTFTLLFFASLLLVTSIFFTSISFNPIQNRYGNKQLIFTFLPQGWSFFTRNPREAQVLLYKIDGKRIIPITQKHSSYKNLFGLIRKSSIYTSEIQIIRSKINDSLFFNTKWNYQENKIGLVPKGKITIYNEIFSPLLCGEYLLVFQEPIPWAWSKNMKSIKMPAKIIRINIKCIR
jgi:antimicrobial peptide system SdpA family protein